MLRKIHSNKQKKTGVGFPHELKVNAMNLTQSIFKVAVLVSLLSCAFGQGKNPCHPKKAANGNGVQCEHVVLPPGLCNNCALKPVSGNGSFKKCNSIYNINTNKCKTELLKYVQWNSCDKKRSQQYKGLFGEGSKGNVKFQSMIGLDYFVYSVCEQCCDCIKKGSTLANFGKGPKFVANRGNCPSHAYFDVCKVLPHIRGITFPGGPKKPQVMKMPKVCQLLVKWMQSKDSAQWLSNHNANVPKTVQNFLNLMNKSNKCASESVWKSCVKLEKAQGRI